MRGTARSRPCQHLTSSLSLSVLLHCQAEYRVSLYGRDRGEPSRLAAWFMDNKMASPNVSWMFQIPRIL
jgi:AMP deaminase